MSIVLFSFLPLPKELGPTAWGRCGQQSRAATWGRVTLPKGAACQVGDSADRDAGPGRLMQEPPARWCGACNPPSRDVQRARPGWPNVVSCRVVPCCRSSGRYGPCLAFGPRHGPHAKFYAMPARQTRRVVLVHGPSNRQ